MILAALSLGAPALRVLRAYRLATRGLTMVPKLRPKVKPTKRAIDAGDSIPGLFAAPDVLDVFPRPTKLVTTQQMP